MEGKRTLEGFFMVIYPQFHFKMVSGHFEMPRISCLEMPRISEGRLLNQRQDSAIHKGLWANLVDFGVRDRRTWS